MNINTNWFETVNQMKKTRILNGTDFDTNFRLRKHMKIFPIWHGQHLQTRGLKYKSSFMILRPLSFIIIKAKNWFNWYKCHIDM